MAALSWGLPRAAIACIVITVFTVAALARKCRNVAERQDDADVLAVARAAGVVREPTEEEAAAYLEWLAKDRALRTPQIRLMTALLGYDPREGRQR